MASTPHMHISLSAGRGYVIFVTGSPEQSTQIAISPVEARAIAAALVKEADAADQRKAVA
jgi:hypothetical protein